MVWYEANRDYYKWWKLAGRSPGNDDEVSTISVLHINWVLYLRVAKVWNEATLLKKGFILQSKGAYFQKIGCHAMRGTAWPLHFKFGSYAYDIAYKYSQFRPGNKATGQLMYLHMHGLNFTMKSWAGFLPFMSVVHAMHDWLYLKWPAVDGWYKQKPEVAMCALTSLWVVNTALGK